MNDADRTARPAQSPVLVYGAYGHTGRFVVRELLRAGITPVASGRDPDRLAALAAEIPGLQTRPAAVDDDRALSAVMREVAVVVNCAGPFLDTSLRVAGAAVRAGAHYLDLTAEQAAAQQLYRAHGELRWPSDIAVIPAMAFYGGLADLMATTAAAEWEAVDEIIVVAGIDRWWPTEGTRRTGRRNTATRLIVEDGRLVPAPQTARRREWAFPEPLGRQSVSAAPLTEIVLLHRHLAAARIESYVSTSALKDISDPATSAPAAVDATGRSAQRFVVDVVVRRGREERRISVSGQDIYAATAPLVVEAALRLLDGRAAVRGAATPAQVFDSADVLDSLRARGLTVRR